MGFVVDELFAFVATDDDGDEGVMAALMGETWYPLVAADLVRIQQFAPLANAAAKETGVEFKLKHFKLLGDVSDEYLEQFKELPEPAEAGADETDQRDESPDERKPDCPRGENGNGKDLS